MSVMYFAHSYRERDAPIVDYFGRLMRSEGLVPSLDPPSESVNSARLQRHLNSSDGMVAVLSRREGGTSPHILFEVSLAVRAGLPVLAFVEDTLPNDAVSRHIPQSRFSYRWFLRENTAHRQALKFLKAYIAATPMGGYRPVGRRRSCLVLQPAGVSAGLVESTCRWIDAEGDYDVEALLDTDRSSPWQPFDAIRSASAVVTFTSNRFPRSYLAGFATGVGVPMIELTTEPDHARNRPVPSEYQPRVVTDPDALPIVLKREFDLFEEDFLELSTQDEVDRYTRLLIDLRGQAGAVGRNASSKNLTFNQIWNEQSAQLPLPELAGELETLRQALKEQATTREHDTAVAEIGAAADAADQGDGPETMSRLAKAGKWALGVATTIGTTVAAQAIKAAIGL